MPALLSMEICFSTKADYPPRSLSDLGLPYCGKALLAIFFGLFR